MNGWKIIEPANILEPGQGGGRQGCCVGINMQKVHFIQQESRRQGKRVYRVDINFKNAFNAMSQAVLWQVMRMFKIPDVDLLEQIYEGATIRLSPNDEESATITFNTGVALSAAFLTFSLMPRYACSRLQDRMKILVKGCRSARIRKETTSEMKTVINSTT